ncbi:MAG: peroxiredoxin [Gammaproteobacteria bacterium]
MRSLKLVLLLMILLVGFVVRAADAPRDGQMAPDFRLQDQNGAWRSLSQYHGQWVVLYFYPKDETPGCTTEACTFRDDLVKFQTRGVHVLGVSLDDTQSHAEFAAKYHLPFPLLADTTHQVAASYGVLTSFLGLFHYARRETFLIDPQGRVARHYRDVDPKANAGQVLSDLAGLIRPPQPAGSGQPPGPDNPARSFNSL